MRIEIIDKDVVNPKITIAQDRASLKIPIDYNGFPDRTHLIQLFHELIEEIGIPEKTIRGTLKEGTHYLRLVDGKNKQVLSVNIYQKYTTVEETYYEVHIFDKEKIGENLATVTCSFDTLEEAIQECRTNGEYETRIAKHLYYARVPKKQETI